MGGALSLGTTDRVSLAAASSAKVKEIALDYARVRGCDARRVVGAREGAKPSVVGAETIGGVRRNHVWFGVQIICGLGLDHIWSGRGPPVVSWADSATWELHHDSRLRLSHYILGNTEGRPVNDSIRPECALIL